MFASGNHTVMGSSEDPKDGKSVATAVFGAVVIYGVSACRTWALEAGGKLRLGEPKLILQSFSYTQVFLLFCGSQALLHKRQTAGGEIALR